MWRPDGWEQTLRGILDSFNVTYMNSEECKLIEAGADAMLEVLYDASRKGWLRIDKTDSGDILIYIAD